MHVSLARVPSGVVLMGLALPCRCFLALIDTLAKHMMMMRDAFFHELVTFLEAAEQHGKEVQVVIPSGPHDTNVPPPDKNSVSYEARLLKKMLLKLRE